MRFGVMHILSTLLTKLSLNCVERSETPARAILRGLTSLTWLHVTYRSSKLRYSDQNRAACSPSRISTRHRYTCVHSSAVNFDCVLRKLSFVSMSAPAWKGRTLVTVCVVCDTALSVQTTQWLLDFVAAVDDLRCLQVFLTGQYRISPL